MQFEFDPELLIDEIKCRPGIWDKEDVQNRSREMRSKLWNEIIDVMLQDQKVTKSEKRELELQLQKKWKGLRDAYAKYLRDPTKQKRPYLYCNQMQFLLKNRKIGDVEGNFSTDMSFSSQQDDDDKGSAGWKRKKKMRLVKRKKEEPQESEDEIDSSPQYLEDDFDDDDAPEAKTAKTDKSFKNEFAFASVKASNKSFGNEFMFANVDGSSTQAADDCDKMFLLSLLPHLKSIPEEYRLNAKMELLQVLQNANKSAGEIERVDRLN